MAGNYFLEPLDKFITETLGFKKAIRYLDDIVIFGDNKKELHKAIIAIQQFIGRRFRLRLKRTWQVCRFWYKKGMRTLRGKEKSHIIGRQLDFMGFVFKRNRTVLRKRILFATTRIVRKLHKVKESGGRFFRRHVSAVLSYMGWFKATDTGGCYQDRIKPFVNIGKLKKIISKEDREKECRATEPENTVPAEAEGKEERNRLYIYTDGSAIQKGRKRLGAGWAYKLRYNSRSRARSGNLKKATNNEAEIEAVYQALKAVTDKTRPTTVFSDSLLMVNVINGEWEPRKNTEIWSRLFKERDRFKSITFKWIKSHNGNKHNEEVDKAARKAAMEVIQNEAVAGRALFETAERTRGSK